MHYPLEVIGISLAAYFAAMVFNLTFGLKWSLYLFLSGLLGGVVYFTISYQTIIRESPIGKVLIDLTFELFAFSIVFLFAVLGLLINQFSKIKSDSDR